MSDISKVEYNPNSIFFNSGSEIDEIIQPLKENFGVNFMSFHRFYWDSTYISFTNNDAWPKYFWENNLIQYHDKTPNIASYITNHFKYSTFFNDDYPTNSNFQQHIIKTLKEKFNTDHLVYFVKHSLGQTNLFTFGVPPENTKFNREFLINEDYFQHFALHFFDKAKHLIKEAKKQKLYFDHNIFEDVSPNTIFEKNEQLKSNDLETKRFYLDGEYEDIYLTKREKDCIMLLKQGFNYYEIAKNLNLSRKTVQQYIDAIRIKLNCQSKSHLLSLVNQSKLIDMFPNDNPITKNNCSNEELSKMLFNDLTSKYIKFIDQD